MVCSTLPTNVFIESCKFVLLVSGKLPYKCVLYEDIMKMSEHLNLVLHILAKIVLIVYVRKLN